MQETIKPMRPNKRKDEHEKRGHVRVGTRPQGRCQKQPKAQSRAQNNEPAFSITSGDWRTNMFAHEV